MSAEKVLETMKTAGKALKVSEILEMTELSSAEVDRAMKELKNGNHIISPKRCFWEPK